MDETTETSAGPTPVQTTTETPALPPTPPEAGPPPPVQGEEADAPAAPAPAPAPAPAEAPASAIEARIAHLEALQADAEARARVQEAVQARLVDPADGAAMNALGTLARTAETFAAWKLTARPATPSGLAERLFGRAPAPAAGAHPEGSVLAAIARHQGR